MLIAVGINCPTNSSRSALNRWIIRIFLVKTLGFFSMVCINLIHSMIREATAKKNNKCNKDYFFHNDPTINFSNAIVVAK